ncbi:hypothetical protein J2847_002176 [Azospirillum agricola]|nr:hypothetical protein [Azospirillum agricola]
MSEAHAGETLKAVTGWARYARLFTDDDETEAFAFDEAGRSPSP